MQSIYLLISLGIGLGLLIGIFVRLFSKPTDPRIDEIQELLPNTNCGACGFAGCADFAKALAEGHVTPEGCPVSSPEEVQRMGRFLGITVGRRTQQVAVVHCGGDNRLAGWPAEYNGVADCRSANMVAGGAKACKYGCLGLGSCARACPFDAIEITRHGLAVVHPDVCTGCGACVPICPRDLIELRPVTAPVHNLCSSPEKGAVSRKVCKVSCIACRKCVKAAGEGQMFMDGDLAKVNYDNPPAVEIVEVCPTKCLRPSLTVRTDIPALEDPLPGEKRETADTSA